METALASSASLTPPGLMVFAGSAERDVAFAKVFWDSVTLQPLLESQLPLGFRGPRVFGGGGLRFGSNSVAGGPSTLEQKDPLLPKTQSGRSSGGPGPVRVFRDPQSDLVGAPVGPRAWGKLLHLPLPVCGPGFKMGIFWFS
uniref:Cilia- and flagella-associated protein HOATZ n=1 Tax=Gopherus evgoodei TaxID=1825980 RepID=A0A8C5F1N5_9SAUR